jgi:hypothetical protein
MPGRRAGQPRCRGGDLFAEGAGHPACALPLWMRAEVFVQHGRRRVRDRRDGWRTEWSSLLPAGVPQGRKLPARAELPMHPTRHFVKANHDAPLIAQLPEFCRKQLVI